MKENPPNDPNNPPVTNREPYEHADGTRVCFYRPYWVGNIRDGHWEFGYWYRKPDDIQPQYSSWRWCGMEHN